MSAPAGTAISGPWTRERAPRWGPGLNDVVARAPFSESFRALWSGRLLDRPLFVPDDELDRLTGDLQVYFRALTSLPARLFDGDLMRYGAALGMPERRVELLRRLAGPAPTPYGRADLFHDGESFRLLEFNVASDVGGLEYPEFNRALLAVPAFGEYARAHRLGYVDTAGHVATLWRAASAAAGLAAEPCVGVVGANGNTATLARLLDATGEAVARHGITMRVGELPDVRHDGARLLLGGEPVDVVLRFFTVDDLWDDAELLGLAEPVFRAHEDGDIVLWTPLDSSLYSNKGAMALLSDPRARDAFEPDELAALDALLPWTRLVTTGSTDIAGQTVDLIDYCRSAREDLVLKPSRGFGGDGVLAGWETTDRDWRERLAACRDRDWVVQRRVTPAPVEAIGDADRSPSSWAITWGVFLTPGGYGGAMARGLPCDGSTVLYFGNARARSTGVFSYPAAEVAS